MGTFGEGNLDNDAALDRLGDLVDSLSQEITETLEGDEFGIDEGFDEAMALVEVLRVLGANTGAAPPKAAMVTKWKKRMLRVFDDEIEAMDPSEGFAEGRRGVIVKTFDEMIGHSQGFWKK